MGKRTEWFTGQPEEGVRGLGHVCSRGHPGHAGDALVHVCSLLHAFTQNIFQVMFSQINIPVLDITPINLQATIHFYLPLSSRC